MDGLLSAAPEALEVPRKRRLSHAQRLHAPRDFERVYAGKQAVHASEVVVFYSPNGMQRARLGVSVSTKHGNAVRRNRIKRVFRAAYRQCQSILPQGFDYVLIPRKGVKEYSTALVAAALIKASKRF